jgi:hypothetical protein
MHSRPTPFALATASLLLCAAWCAVPASAGSFSPGQSDSGSKSNCTDASGKTTSSKDCDKISSDRMSTRANQSSLTKLKTTTKGANTTSHTKTSNGSTASSQSSAAAPAAAAPAAEKEPKKEADTVGPDRMSTRGLTPPKQTDQDKNKTSKPDGKTDTTPDTTNPK